MRPGGRNSETPPARRATAVDEFAGFHVIRHSVERIIGRTILLLTQTFPPDPAAVGQHFGDAARELARRGYDVVVIAAAAGYHDPAVRYPSRERTRDGVVVRRVPFSSLGKSSVLRRIVASVAFMGQALALGLFLPGLAGVVFSTSPPFIGVIGVVIGLVRRVKVGYWVMDLNPDQLVALGEISATSILARLLSRANRFVLRRSSVVVALDWIMAARIASVYGYEGQISVIPPWSPDEALEPVARSANPFRALHGLTESTVVMYSGNHTRSNPLTTLLEAAVRLRGESRLRFVFVGDGAGKSEVERYRREHTLPNLLSLPYQPLDNLSVSLAAADVHVVSLGDRMAGIIHPSKVYGAMAVGRPVLFFGPQPSHVSDLIREHGIGWQVAHGDVESAVTSLRRMLEEPSTLEDMGRRGRQAIDDAYSPDRLCGRFCDAIELGLRLQRA